MPKLKKNAKKATKIARMGDEMAKFKAGKLHSGSKKGPIVKRREQAIAIGLSESGQSKKQRKKVGKLKHSSRHYGKHAKHARRKKSYKR